MALAVLLVAGCAGSQPVNTIVGKDEFPQSRYLTAEAGGESEGAAKRAAMAELAAIFESRVYARTLEQATSWKGEGLPEQFDRQVEQTVQIDSDVQLEGARIGLVQPDAATGGYRALAVLDRRQAAGRWQRKLSDVQAALDSRVAALDAVEGRLSRLAALNRITALKVHQAALQSRLSVLGQPVETGIQDHVDLIAERERLAGDIALAVQVDGNPAAAFTRRLSAALSADGYRLTSHRDEAAGLITGSVWVQPLDLGNPDVHFIRALVDIQLVDLDSDTPLAAFDESLRKGHVDEGEAARRSVNGLAEHVAGKLAGVLGTLGIAAVTVP
jgi:hypothetical protein